MRIAVVSDIHGNMDAFSRVLEDIDRSGVDRIVSLGDNVGYGAEPEAVILAIKERGIVSVMGNHEMAVLDPGHLQYFSPVTRKALIKNKNMLSEGSMRYIRGLKLAHDFSHGLFVHGAPPDSATTYILGMSENSLCGILKALRQRICFVGHTHALRVISYDGKKLLRTRLSSGVRQVLPHMKYIINVGSVGQSRDASADAKYVIWDSSDHTIQTKFISYDVDMAAAKIIKAGIPKKFARQLYGVPYERKTS